MTRARSRTTAIGATAILALLLATGCGAATGVTTQDGSAPRPSFPPERSPVSLWLSASEVPPGAEVVAILRNPTGAEAMFGVAATVDRWDGGAWLPYRFLGMCIDGWSCTGQPGPLDGDRAASAIGLTASAERPGPAERFSTAGLDPGWYRIRQTANEKTEATGILHVVDGAPAPAPLSPLDQPGVSIVPALVSAGGGRVLALPLIPAHGPQTIGDVVAATAHLAETATLERWDGTAWREQATVTLTPGTDGPGPHLDRTADVPALPAGAYRFVRPSTDSSADHTGRFWVLDDDPSAGLGPSSTTTTFTGTEPARPVSTATTGPPATGPFPTTTTVPSAEPGPFACPSPAELAARASRRPTVVEVKESQVPLDGFRLDPPPPGPAPKISADDAVRRADASLGGAPDPGPEPTIALGLFSDDNGMIHMNPDGSETKLIQSRLTWVILYPHSIVGPGSGGPAGIAGQPTTTTTALPCYLGTVLIPVDATTGEVLFTQSNGEGVGH